MMIAQAVHTQLLPMRTLKKVSDVIQKDRRLRVRAVAGEVNLDRESVQRILREEMNMRKVFVKMVPKVVRQTKRTSQGIGFGLLQCTENEPGLLNSIISCDETWIFMYDPETK